MYDSAEYVVRIPIEIYGRDNLVRVLDGIKGISTATNKLTQDQRDFINVVRDETNALQNLDKALKSIISGGAGASESHRMMAMGLRSLMLDLRNTEVAADKVTQAFGRVGGRIVGAELLGRAAGIPGGGFIGSQLVYSLGGVLPGTALAGIAAGSAGLVAAYGGYRLAEGAGQYAQQQQNLARSMGSNPQDMQLLGRVAQVSDVQVGGLLNSMKSLNRIMGEGGSESKRVQQAFGELGLSASTAFSQPERQLTDVIGALRRIGDESERERLSVMLLGEAGRSLLPLVDTFKSISDAVKQSGVIIDQDGIQRLVKFRQESKELELVWETLKTKMAAGLVAKIEWITNGNLAGTLLPTIGGAGTGAVGGAIYGFVGGGPVGALLGALGGGLLGGISGATVGSLQSHYGATPLPEMPSGDIPSGIGTMSEQRLNTLNAIRPLGETHVETLQRQMHDVENKIPVARQQYLTGTGRMGLRVAGDPGQMSALESELRSLGGTSKDIYQTWLGNEASIKSWAFDHPGVTPTHLYARRAKLQSDKTRAEQIESQLSSGRRMVPYFLPGENVGLDTITGLEQQRVGLKGQIKSAQEYESQLHSFGTLSPQSEMTLEGVAHEGSLAFGRQFGRLHDLPAYKARMVGAQGAEHELTESTLEDLSLRYVDRIVRQMEHTERTNQTALGAYWRGEVQGATTNDRSRMIIAQGSTTELMRRSRIGAAIGSGYSGYGLTPNQESIAAYQATISGIAGEYGARSAGLGGEISALQRSSLQYGNIPTDEAARKKEVVDAEITQRQAELKSAEADATTRAIDAINRFNESTEKAAMAIRSEFAGGFTSIIMGAQHGGGHGVLSALRGFGEGQEGKFLHNIGEKVFDSGIKDQLAKMGMHLPDWLSKGTILGHGNDPIKLNTDATDKNTDAINRLNSLIEHLGGGGSGTGGTGAGAAGAGTPAGATVPGAGASPATDAAGEVAGIANAAASLSGVTTGSTAVALGATATSLSKLSSVLKGTKYAGDFGKIFGGTLHSGELVGAVAGTAALGLAAYGGISTIAHGGAKNAAGGLGITLGAIAPMTGPAAPFVAAAAAIAGMVSAFIPDARMARSNEMSKRMFTQQYLAPEAIHMMASGSGSYADLGIHGEVRTSHFSPYPIVSDSYLDVPRRTVVPGHDILGFGGYQNVTGAKTPSIVHIHNWNIHTMDAKSFNDNAVMILNAVNRGLNENYHPVIKTMGKQLGIK